MVQYRQSWTQAQASSPQFGIALRNFLSLPSPWAGRPNVARESGCWDIVWAE